MRNKIIFSLAALWLLIGVGCKSNERPESLLNSEIDDGAIETVIEFSEEISAQKRSAMDFLANLLPVALVLTEGSTEPDEGVERLSRETFGCSDRIGYVRVSRESASNEIVSDALETLFSIRDPQVNGMINSLWESNLKVDKVLSIDGQITEVWLSGEILSSGVCADPRIKAQIEATIRQYRSSFQIYLNGSEANWRCFGDMSGLCQ
jgi:hypothetical protein